MVASQSCDHHDQTSLVPSNRSRHRILEQFEQAIRLRSAVEDLSRGGLTINLYTRDGEPCIEPTVTLELGAFIRLWHQLNQWRAVEPRGDDLTPPFTRGAEIRVPPDEEEPSGLVE